MFSGNVFDSLGFRSLATPEVQPAEMPPEVLADRINQNVAAIGLVTKKLVRLMEPSPNNPAPGQGAF